MLRIILTHFCAELTIACHTFIATTSKMRLDKWLIKQRHQADKFKANYLRTDADP